MRDALYLLERSRPATLQAQIREVLMGSISSGHLLPGEPVPSTRAMAGRLGVSRNTVTLAYQALVAEGFLMARERSGFYVDSDASAGLAPLPETADTVPRGTIDWRERSCRNLTDHRFIQRPIDWQKQPYPFIYGQVDHEIFPIAEWRDCVRQAMGRRWLDAWTEDQYTRDDPLLVEEITRRILPRRGVRAEPDQVLITLGAQNALYLICALLAGHGTVAAVEEPGYPDLRNMLMLRGARTLPIPVDEEGLPPDGLAKADLVFTTPSHHYPTTVAMPIDRQKALLKAAAAQDFVVVEDDYEFETNYGGQPLPALKSLDRDGRVIHIGSFSKYIAPGLRIGYIVAAADFIREARLLRRLVLRHPPANNQRTLALFIAGGYYDALVQRLQRSYRERWEAMTAALEAHMPVEREATHRALSLAEIVDLPIVIVHVSNAAAIEEIRRARARGMKVTAETCPQYLVLTEDDLDGMDWEGAKFVCSPPPRNTDEQAACWEGLTDGTFDLFSSDHCPFRYEGTDGKMNPQGAKNFRYIPNGIPGVETRLPILFSEGVGKGRITLQQFVALSATNHARTYGLYPQKGTIAVGSDADIAIWDANLTRTVTHEALHDGADYSPYEGMTLTGWPTTVVLRGKVMVRDGTLEGKLGDGQYLSR